MAAPLDASYAVTRFADLLRPFSALIVETEIWLNLFFAISDHQRAGQNHDADGGDRKLTTHDRGAVQGDP